MSAFENTIPLRLVPDSTSVDREAVIPPYGRSIIFGMHGEVAEHYKYVPKKPESSTLDYLVASVGGCLIGTFAGSMMRARIPFETEALVGEARGEMASDDDGVLRLRKITVAYELELDPEHHEAAREVHDRHAARCPNARSVMPAIEIETELELVAPVVA